MLNEILEFAKEISIEAGALLLRGFRSDETKISYKSRTNLVTNMDHASELLLFKKISDRFPSHAIIAEEGSIKETKGESVWYVDPIDGTNNYAHGLPFFCVSLGIFSHDLRHMGAGVVYNPYMNEMFTALRGGGALLNGAGISVSSIDDIGISVLSTGFPYDRDNVAKNNIRQFNAPIPRIQGIRRFGSAAIDLSYVACGRLDGYWEGQLNPWDTAAGSLIAEEAGGMVTRYDGGVFDCEYPEVVASNGKIHTQIINILAESLS